jgi:hypothetical protein
MKRVQSIYMPEAAPPQCDECGSVAVLSYIEIPASDRDADGSLLDPADWSRVIECPKCGTREQSRSRPSKSTASDRANGGRRARSKP